MKFPDRRQFLASTTATVITLGCSRAAGLAAVSPARKMKIDLSCDRIGVKADQETAIDLASRHGFEAVVPSPGDLAKLAPAQLKELKARLTEKNLVFSAAGLPVDFRGGDDTFAKGMKTLPETAAMLRRAGVTRIGTWLKPFHEDLSYLRNFRQHVSRLRQVGTLLADHGLRFGLEYVGPRTLWASKRHPFIHTMTETKDLLAEIDLPSVGFVLDSWHWYTAHETAEDVLSLTNAQVIAVDLNDAPKGIAIDEQIDSKRELPAATGVIDVAGFLRALQKIGYDGPVRAEPFSAALRKLPAEEAVAATAAAMKKAFSQAQLA